jgi:RNA polymerase sigma factor (TIGR02999 family)
MSEITQILAAVREGDSHTAEKLLPLVYEELRQLAGARMAEEKPGQTLQATALVHEAYLRLVAPGDAVRWENRRHFFAAAAEAMRRILVEAARRKRAVVHGGEFRRIDLPDELLAQPNACEELLDLDRALTKLAGEDPQAARLVELRHFTGLTIPEAAETLGISPRSADRLWAYARAWLHREITEGKG